MVFSRIFRRLAIATLLFGVGQFAYFYPTSAAFFQGAVSSVALPSLSCSYTPVTSGTQGTAYTGATPSASGGTPSYTFSQTGTLPGGLTISSSTGIISGTPSASGSFPSIQVKVTDSASSVANCGSAFTLAISSSTCPQGTAIADGCSGAQAVGHGTIVNANLATPQQVIALNILGGTGYASGGPYTWTSTGGGCSSAASGTVSVVGGVLQQSSYTISSQGAGCTSRPTIAIPSGAAGGTGGSIISTVYQLTPHNCTSKTVCNSAIGAIFNVPGVDYPVGADPTLTYSDPTAGGLPSGATFSGHTVTVSSNNVTLSGWNFALHGTRLAIGANVTGTVVTNNKFACIHGTTTDQSNFNVAGGNLGTTTIKYNDFNGGATSGVGCISGGMTANVTFAGNSGTVIFEYNYCFNSDSKCINFAGVSANTLSITEGFNYYWNFGICGSGCSHGEAEYSFGSSGGSSQLLSPWINQHNVMLSDFGNDGSNLTAPVAIVADGILITNADVEFNLALGQGTQSYTGSSNSNQQSVSSSIFAGHQETGVMTSGTLKNNFLDYSGGFDPYNGSGGTGSGDFPGTADFNAGSGNGCNWTTCN